VNKIFNNSTENKNTKNTNKNNLGRHLEKILVKLFFWKNNFLILNIHQKLSKKQKLIYNA